MWTDIHNFYNSNIVSHKLPSVKGKGRHFLNLTFEECFGMYKEGCMRDGKQHISFSTFCRLHPKSVFKVDPTPDQQCICEQCENFRLMKNMLIKLGVAGIAPHAPDCIKMSFCKVDNDFDRSDRLSNRKDSFHQVNPGYGHIECITRNCQSCGIATVQLKILQENSKLEENMNIVQWNRCMLVDKFPGSKSKKIILRTEPGTRKDLLDVFLKDLKLMSQHVFSANWNYAMFQYVRNNLKPGYLLQVLDFGQSYLNIFQEEPQAKHWDHKQTTIHQIVNFYIKPGETDVTIEEHIIIFPI